MSHRKRRIFVGHCKLEQFTLAHTRSAICHQSKPYPRVCTLCAFTLCGYNCNSQGSTTISLNIAFVLLVSLIALNNNHIKLPIHFARMHCSRWTRRLFWSSNSVFMGLACLASFRAKAVVVSFMIHAHNDYLHPHRRMNFPNSQCSTLISVTHFTWHSKTYSHKHRRTIRIY